MKKLLTYIYVDKIAKYPRPSGEGKDMGEDMASTLAAKEM